MEFASSSFRATTTMDGLGVPQEVVEHTLTFCHPFDVASFSRTCRFAHDIVYRNRDSHLWRQLFLFYPFDDPRRSLKAKGNPVFVSEYDWKAELLRRIKAEEIAFRSTVPIAALKDVLDTFISVIQEAAPVTKYCDLEPSHNALWLTRILRDSYFLDTASNDEQVSQLIFRLKSFFGLSFGDVRPDARLRKRRSESRCYVYDLRNYRFDNNWGPFLVGGAVNWEHVQAILVVIVMNLSELPEEWSINRPPVGFDAARAYSAPDCFSGEATDWAGVEGTWRRYVCFMDYRDLFAFNYVNINDPRDQSFFETQHFREATRLIECKLRLVPLEAIQLRNRVPPEFYLPQTEGPESLYPPLCFSGYSRGMNTRHAIVEGTVRMGSDGVVRWQFTSIYDGRTQWCSEGIQVANVASAIGIVGTWTGAHHSPGDPVGPFWMWRVPGDHPDDLIDFH